MTSVAIVSDFSAEGSGYMHIASNLGIELVRRGYSVYVVGVGYNGEEHNYPYPVIPAGRADYRNQIQAILHNMMHEEPAMLTHVIFAFDIPQQLWFSPLGERFGFKQIGVFPLEAPPLITSRAMGLLTLSDRFTISQFAADAFAAKGVSATHLPIPVDMQAWRTPTREERQAIRESMNIELDKKVVLTVADNQERKNLSTTLEIIAGVPDVLHFLVTRGKLAFGWAIDDLISDLGLQGRVFPFERGIPFKQLWSLFAMSDAFLITSKAEGLGMPVLESMSVGIPVVAPDHTSFHEHLSDGRGYLFDNAYQYTDPFGNENRYFADVEEGIHALRTALYHPFGEVIESAKEYLAQRSWENVGNLICKALT